MGIRFSQNQPNLLNTRLNKADTKGSAGSASSAGSAGSAGSASSAGSANAAKKPTIMYEVKTQAFEQPNSRPCAAEGSVNNSGGCNVNNYANGSALIQHWKEMKRAAENAQSSSGIQGSGESAAMKDCRQKVKDEIEEVLFDCAFAIDRLSGCKEAREEELAELVKKPDRERTLEDENAILDKLRQIEWLEKRIGEFSDYQAAAKSVNFDDL